MLALFVNNAKTPLVQKNTLGGIKLRAVNHGIASSAGAILISMGPLVSRRQPDAPQPKANAMPLQSFCEQRSAPLEKQS